MDLTMRAITIPSTDLNLPATATAVAVAGVSFPSQGQGLEKQGMIPVTKDSCLLELKRLADLITQPY